MSEDNFKDKFFEVVKYACKELGFTDGEAEAHAWQCWAEFLEQDIDQEEGMLLKSGICPNCHETGWLMPVDYPLEHYSCLNCGEEIFLLEVNENG